MSMTILIPDNSAHFPLIPVELLDEFEALELASNEDFARFDQQEQV